MNRPDRYLKQLHGLQAWLRAQGDDEGADQADDLAERLNRNHNAVDNQDEPPWTGGPDFEADVEPDIRCRPEVGVVYMNSDGEPILTIDMLDGGDVAVVHMGDVVRWVERRGAPDPDGTVTLPHANPVVGSVGKNKRGWWACVDTTRRKLGMPFKAGGMRSRHDAVRWLLAHALDWRTYP